jgi:hypothetical protein
MEKEIENLNFDEDEENEILDEKTKSLIRNLDGENKISTNIKITNGTVKEQTNNFSSEFKIPEIKSLDKEKEKDSKRNNQTVSSKPTEESNLHI